MSDSPTNFLTEIGETIRAVNPRNYRHREELKANRFDQVVYFAEEEEQQKEVISKKNKVHEQKPESVLTDSDSEDDSSSESNSENEQSNNDDSFSESSSVSDNESEEYNIWDNSEFEMYGIDLDNLKFCKNEEQSFFTQYKLRYCQIRNFLTKKLTQNQHLDINVNILKILKGLSNNKLQAIQCHNYNYFQSLSENPQYQRFAQHYKKQNNSQRRQQLLHKQEFLNSMQKSKKITKVMVPQIFQGIKVAMNRASFSSSSTKESSPQEYFLTSRNKQQLGLGNQNAQSTKGSNIDCSLLTSDTINSQAKRTIKDFDIDVADQKDNSGQESSMQTVNTQASHYYITSQIPSLNHIPDHNEVQKSATSIAINNGLNNTPQKKFKISHLQTNKSFTKIPGSGNSLTPQITITGTKTVLPSQVPSPLANGSNSPNQLNAINSNSGNQAISQARVFNNFVSIPQNAINEDMKNGNDFLSPLPSAQLIDSSSPRNKTKLRNYPNSQSNIIPQRESSQIYYSFKQQPHQQIANKPSTSATHMRPLISFNSQNRLNVAQQQTQEDNFLPALKSEKQQNQIDPLALFVKAPTVRSTSNHLNYKYNKISNETPKNNTNNYIPTFITNSPPSTNILKQINFTDKSPEQIKNGNGQIQQHKTECTTPVRMTFAKAFHSPSINTINKLRQQKQVYCANQSYNSILPKENSGDQSQRSSQEYLLHTTKVQGKTHFTSFGAANTHYAQQQQQQQNSSFNQSFTKLPFSSTFFKNQYINKTSTSNNELVQNFKQISQY